MESYQLAYVLNKYKNKKNKIEGSTLTMFERRNGILSED